MKEIPLRNGQSAKVDDEDYEYLSRYSWYAYYDSEKAMTYAAHDTHQAEDEYLCTMSLWALIRWKMSQT